MKVLKDSNYTVLRTLTENLETVKYSNRCVNIYHVHTVHSSSLKRKLDDLRRAEKAKDQKKYHLDWQLVLLIK